MFCRDLFGDPGWPLFGGVERGSGRGGPVLAAISLETRAEGHPWERASLVEANAREVARAVFGTRALSGHRAFLFVAHASWQPAGGRVARYKLERDGLWRSLEKEGDLGPFGRRSAEVAFESDRSVRYAGLLEVKEEALAAAIGLAREKEVYPFSCALVLSDRPDTGSEADVEALFGAAFPTRDRGRGSRVDWPTLSAAVCPFGWAVGRTTGAFDDPWVDTDLFLPGNLGEALARELGAGWWSGPAPAPRRDSGRLR